MLKRASRRAVRGLGLVELMVGLAVGLFVVAGGLLLFGNFVENDRRLMIETRLMQDLRATSDLITRDIRRGGYWAAAHTGVWTAAASAIPQNAYARVANVPCASATAGSAASAVNGNTSSTCYWIAGDADNVPDDDERYGFELDSNVVYAVLGASAPVRVALSDPKTMRVTGLNFLWASQPIDASNFCRLPCVSNCPTVYVRDVRVTLSGEAVTGTGETLQRQLVSSVRLRNDYFSGQCPE